MFSSLRKLTLKSSFFSKGKIYILKSDYFCLFPLNYLALNLAIVIRNIKQQSQVYFHSAIINRYLWIKLDCRHWLRGNNLPFLWRQVCHNSDSVLCGLQLTFVCHSFFRLQTTSLPNFLFIQIPHRLSPLSLSHPTPNIPSAAVRLWLQRCARRVSSAGELAHIRALFIPYISSSAAVIEVGMLLLFGETIAGYFCRHFRTTIRRQPHLIKRKRKARQKKRCSHLGLYLSFGKEKWKWEGRGRNEKTKRKAKGKWKRQKKETRKQKENR